MVINDGHLCLSVTPVGVEHVGVRRGFFACAQAGEAGFNHWTDPGGVRRQAKFHEALGLGAAHGEEGRSGFEQGPEQQSLDVGAVGIKRGFIARVGFEKAAHGAVAFDGLSLGGELLEIIADRGKLFL